MESPVLFGMVLIFLFTLILCGTALGTLYWKYLAKVASTQQIACPLNKFCPAGTDSQGYSAGVQVILPTDYDDLTDNEYLTFPYYDSFNPTLLTLTVGFDTSTTPIPGTATSYLGITGVGYSEYDNLLTPNITVYVSGLSGYSNVSPILSAIFQEALTQSTSPTKKKAFIEVNTGQRGGNNFFSYQIKVNTFTESIGALTVTSSVSSSSILSGTNTLTFAQAPMINPEHLVDVYQDMNVRNVLQIAPSLDGTGPNQCVEPSFNAEPCANKVYSTEYGVWLDPNWDPTSASSPPTITDNWDDFDDSTPAPSVYFCAPNLDKTIANSSSSGGVAGGNGTAGLGGYQQVQTAPNVTNAISADGTFAGNYVNPQDSSTLNKTNFYNQGLVFCGGATPSLTNTTDKNTGLTSGTDPNPLQPYSSKYPNPDTGPNYTNLGWSS